MRYSVPASFRDLPPEALTPELLAQIKVGVLLGYGFALSLIGTVGLSSLAAFVIGLEARRRIKKSRVGLAGLRLAWWCIIAGALGAILLPRTLLEQLPQIVDALKR